MRQKGLIISYLRTRLSDRLLDFGEDLQLWVERNLDKRFQVVCDPTHGVQTIHCIEVGFFKRLWVEGVFANFY